ncbi:HAD family phosphatase [soil metagenome]
MLRRYPALIFDFGNVVAHFDYAEACDKLGAGIGISGVELLQKARSAGLNPLVKRFESGQMEAEEFSGELCKILGVTVTHAEFAAAWADIFRLNEPLAQLVAALKAEDYRLVLGSNTNAIHANHFRKQFASALAPFDRLVLSYQIGHVKPSLEFYQACAEAAEAPASACVFIDDLPENVEGARAAGLQGLLFRDPPTLRADLSRLGIAFREVESGPRSKAVRSHRG